MLDAIGNSLYRYIDIATETVTDVGVDDRVNVRVNELPRRILAMLRDNPRATESVMAGALQVSDRTIRRHLKTLREQGLLRRVGSDKTGHWEVIEGPQ